MPVKVEAEMNLVCPVYDAKARMVFVMWFCLLGKGAGSLTRALLGMLRCWTTWSRSSSLASGKGRGGRWLRRCRGGVGKREGEEEERVLWEKLRDDATALIGSKPKCRATGERGFGVLGKRHVAGVSGIQRNLPVCDWRCDVWRPVARRCLEKASRREVERTRRARRIGLLTFAARLFD